MRGAKSNTELRNQIDELKQTIIGLTYMLIAEKTIKRNGKRNKPPNTG